MKGALKLNVGFDGKRAVANMTGLGNYSRYAINILSTAFPSSHFRIYTGTERSNDRLDPILARDNVELAIADVHPSCGLTRAFWRTIDMPVQLKNDGIDIYHGLSNELPLTIKDVCPSVVTIHDLIWRRSPKDYSAIDRRIYDFKYGRSARIATRVIAISQCTKNDLVTEFGIDPDKIDVIYQGIDPIYTLPIDTIKRQQVREKYSLPELFIIAVGTVQPRKNQMLAVEGLARLNKAVKLVIVGRHDNKYGDSVIARARQLGVEDRVIFKDVAFADLPAVYSCAALSTYTSRYEGFGLPVVESISCGTPVIACVGSCLEEAGGEGAVYINPDDAAAWATEAEHFIDDIIHRDKTVRLGQRHIKQFSADAFAKATMATYQKAIIDQLS